MSIINMPLFARKCHTRFKGFDSNVFIASVLESKAELVP